MLPDILLLLFLAGAAVTDILDRRISIPYTCAFALSGVILSVTEARPAPDICLALIPGAALLAANGKIYHGCNIENASFGATNCAERTAIFKAVSEGVTDFEAIAIVGNPEGSAEYDYCTPCGICRQVLAEFCDLDTFTVILAKSETDYRSFSLRELLPLAFSLD